MRCDVEHASRLAVIEFVRHTFLDSAVTLNIDDVASLVHLHIGRERDDTSLAERPREEVASAASIAFCVRHFDPLRLRQPLINSSKKKKENNFLYV